MLTTPGKANGGIVKENITKVEVNREINHVPDQLNTDNEIESSWGKSPINGNMSVQR